mgnify:CR=1 FL=1
MRRTNGRPVLVGSASDRSLQPIALSEGAVDFNEAWLQRLVHAHPECLPVDEIEPAFDELLAVCMEFPAKRGPMDNLMMTPEGDLVLVEVKLMGRL